MYKVKRAIIMAAGFGNRLQPITQMIPKPLIEVNGKRMIDTVIGALHQNGIYDIYVVVGYLKEQFAVLEQKYSGLKLIENPYYDTCNNISSLYVARHYLTEDIMIIDGDQIIYNPQVVASEFECSGYNSVWTCKKTDEWLQTVKKGVVVSCSRAGGRLGWQLYGISRWTAQDALKMQKHLEIEFVEKQNRQIYWDDIVMFCHFEEYELGIWKMNRHDVVEIDDMKTLISLDKSYENVYEEIANEEKRN